MLTSTIGKIVPIHQGAYSNVAQYTSLDEVIYPIDGCTYRVKFNKTPPVGTAPNNTTYWNKVANKGASPISGDVIPGGGPGELIIRFNYDYAPTLEFPLPDITPPDVVYGPASSVNNHIPVFDGTDGKHLKSSGVALSNFATQADLTNALSILRKFGTVRAASTVNINLATPGNTVDSVTMSNGQYFLAKNQSTASQNGIYIYNGSSNPATRAPEFDTFDKLVAALITVQEGTTNADTVYICTANSGGTLGSTAVTFALMRASGELLISNNLSELTPNAGAARSSIYAQADLLGVAAVELNRDNTGDRNTYIDIHSAGTPAQYDHSARIIRYSGINGNFALSNTGTGSIDIGSGGALSFSSVGSTFYAANQHIFSGGPLRTLVGTINTDQTPITIGWNSGSVHRWAVILRSDASLDFLAYDAASSPIGSVMRLYQNGTAYYNGALQAGGLRFDFNLGVYDSNFNNLIYGGFFNGSSMTNAPLGSSGWFHIFVQRHNNLGNVYVYQRASQFDTRRSFERICISGAWQDWTEILTNNVAGLPILGGATIATLGLGNITSGTVTIEVGNRPVQEYTNNGAHTLTMSGNWGITVVDIVNGATAGAITTSSFTKVAGDPFTTTNGHKFRCSLSKNANGSLLSIQALQ